MIFYCDPHATTHSLTPEQTERVVYAMSCEIAAAHCEPDGDRINAGDDAMDHIACVLDYLGLSNSPEGYLELVEPWVGFRRAMTPQQPVQPPAEAIAAGTRALADWLNLDLDTIEPQSHTILRDQATAVLAAAASSLPAAERDLQLARELYEAVYPGDSWPDRPADTVWKHLLDTVRAQFDYVDAGRAGDFALLRIALSDVVDAAQQNPRELVAGLRTLLDEHDQAELVANTPDDPAESSGCADGLCCARDDCSVHGDHDTTQWSACANGTCRHGAADAEDDEVLP